jgi:hypothetical protein
LKNIHSYIVSTILVLLALIPPVPLFIPNPDAMWWTILVVLFGFLGFLTIFLKTPLFIKIIAIGGFINCFLSAAPYVAFTSYLSLLFCCYFYILCTKVKDWDIIFKAILTVVIFNLFFMAMQFLGKDSLLNFGLGKNIVEHGIVGNRMQLESFLLVALVLLMAIKGVNKKIVSLIAIAFVLILLVYTDAVSPAILHNPLDGRWPIWKATIHLANQRPLFGWGIGTFKDIFWPLSGLQGKTAHMWRTCHNEFLQILFETGYVGLSFIVGLFGYFFYKLRNNKTLLIGLSLIALDMSIHFPMRVANTVLILITFFAFCNRKPLFEGD